MAGPNNATAEVPIVTKIADGVPDDSQSRNPVFSPGSKRFAFVRPANGVVSGDTNFLIKVFPKNLARAQAIIVSTNQADAQDNADSSGFVLSPDGTKLSFASPAENLVSNDGDTVPDVFVKDLLTRATMVPTGAARTPLSNARMPVFAAKRTKGAFDPRGTQHFGIDIRDLQNGEVARQTTDSEDGSIRLYMRAIGTRAETMSATSVDSEASEHGVQQPILSSDATKIVFWSSPDNPGPKDTNSNRELFVKDLTTGAIAPVTQSAGGMQGDDSDENALIVFSPDDTKILSSSLGSFLVPGDSNLRYEIFEKDLMGREVTRASSDTDGIEPGKVQATGSPESSQGAYPSGDNNPVLSFRSAVADIFINLCTVPSVKAAPVASDDICRSTQLSSNTRFVWKENING